MAQANTLTAPDTFAARGAGEPRHTSLTTLLGRVFGCHHREMGRPFTHEGSTYRVCLACGARRGFDLGSWEMYGPFYHDGQGGS